MTMRCEDCEHADTYPDEEAAGRAGWRMTVDGWLCPECVEARQ